MRFICFNLFRAICLASSSAQLFVSATPPALGRWGSDVSNFVFFDRRIAVIPFFFSSPSKNLVFFKSALLTRHAFHAVYPLKPPTHILFRLVFFKSYIRLSFPPWLTQSAARPPPFPAPFHLLCTHPAVLPPLSIFISSRRWPFFIPGMNGSTRLRSQLASRFFQRGPPETPLAPFPTLPMPLLVNLAFPCRSPLANSLTLVLVYSFLF